MKNKKIKKYLESDYKKKRTLWIRMKYISSRNDKYLKDFQRWLGTLNGPMARGEYEATTARDNV